MRLLGCVCKICSCVMCCNTRLVAPTRKPLEQGKRHNAASDIAALNKSSKTNKHRPGDSSLLTLYICLGTNNTLQPSCKDVCSQHSHRECTAVRALLLRSGKRQLGELDINKKIEPLYSLQWPSRFLSGLVTCVGYAWLSGD